jgi:membrane protein DedA with SNARE-associated domain
MSFLNESLEAALIASATFLSEDLTSIGTGLLIQDGVLGWWPGLLGCFLGIYLGDLGLWGLGRAIGPRVLRWPWVERRVSAERFDNLGKWFDERGWLAIAAARFLPGTRLPLYLAVGILGRNGKRFALWTFVAAAIWTPLLVGLVALTGTSVVVPLQRWVGGGWLTAVLAGSFIFVVMRGLLLGSTPIGRARIAAAIARLWRWEFWPMWLFYSPVIPWIAWLMIRHRSFTVWTAANPGIPQGGVVGESKYDILRQLPEKWIVSSGLLPSGSNRLEYFKSLMDEMALHYPVVLKPDMGQRGAGVKLIRCEDDAADYLETQPSALILQKYHPGPYEAGVFYYRTPGESKGRIFTITDKRFPVVIGDGRSSVEELIWAHPRFRMQAATFLARHSQSATRVLDAGEAFQLAMAGNHCQGTLFLDGAALITPELERRFDEIADHFPGFHFGRFDVRYESIEDFKAGRDIAIVELNGVTAESTNIYDPRRSLLSAYATLYRQWEILFRIGAANRRRGHEPASVRELTRLLVAHLRAPDVTTLAD